MSLRECKGCGKGFRSGVMALVIYQGGRVGKHRVCVTCMQRGVTIVAQRVPDKVVKKEVRSDGVERALRMLRTYRSAAQGLVGNGVIDGDAHRFDDWANGKTEGIDIAIQTLEREGS